MTNRHKSQGISLLEQLLAIGLILIIVLIGLARYNSYQRELEVRDIKSDLNRIFFAMDQYFHFIGCKPDGAFPATQDSSDTAETDPFQPDISKTLKLYDLAQGREPLPGIYTAKIVQFDKRQDDHKPLYQFHIIAKPKHTLSPQKITFLLKQTNGYLAEEDNSLHWRALPANPLAKSSSRILGLRLHQWQQSLSKQQTSRNHFYCAQ